MRSSCSVKYNYFPAAGQVKRAIGEADYNEIPYIRGSMGILRQKRPLGEALVIIVTTDFTDKRCHYEAFDCPFRRG
jgi:hypothetical protein